MKKLFIALLLSLFVNSWCFAEGNQAPPAQVNTDTQTHQPVKKEKTKVKKHKNRKKKADKQQAAQTETKK